jgi:hypothetical protein
MMLRGAGVTTSWVATVGSVCALCTVMKGLSLLDSVVCSGSSVGVSGTVGVVVTS